jgi:membrane protein DedA with SNARE-associated domain
VQAIFDWLVALPPMALYAALAFFAALENVFPPVPADTIVALGSFLAARGNGEAWAAFLATWLGNVGGAMLMYALGHRYGARRLEKRLLGDKGPGAEKRLESLYGRYGIAAIFASRFLPGVRAIVPPFAGALRIPPLRAMIAIGSASAIWYGTVSYLGFTVGGNWQRVTKLINEYGRILSIAAAIILAVGLAVWWVRTRKARQA